MNPAERLLALYDRVAEAPEAVPRLRRFVLDLAVRGKLAEQDLQEGHGDDRTSRLHPSAPTRESLRRSITLFGSSERSNVSVPYWWLGSGVINAMVFSLLTFIAKLKSNVIFAMEEPETARRRRRETT